MYTVTKIENQNIHPKVNLGNPTLEELLQNILKQNSPEGNVFKVTWVGKNRVPQGAVVDGHTIAWTQHGIVQEANKENRATTIGTYQRIKDLDGPNHDENEMLIQLDETTIRS